MNKLLIIPFLFILADQPDSTKVDTAQKPMKLFFEQRTNEQRAEDINIKLDSILVKLQAMNDSTKIK